MVYLAPPLEGSHKEPGRGVPPRFFIRLPDKGASSIFASRKSSTPPFRHGAYGRNRAYHALTAIPGRL